MKDHESAFPVMKILCGYNGEVLGLDCATPGMTLKQYAAIHLKVPRSGDPEIDDMIRESRRADFAKEAMHIIADKRMSWPESSLHEDWPEYLAGDCGFLANAMLAEWEKGAGNGGEV
jgi:hypothetical protein